ncbi:hypothetical protein PIB30_097258, partial [Stylosanthes scabra]|nr:hypothetical protein [Stylosanthes scabra]
GFAWNEEKQCIEIDSKDVLDVWLKAILMNYCFDIQSTLCAIIALLLNQAYPKKFYTLGKAFPMFRRLGRIFRKDWVTGSAAISGFDVEEKVDEDPGEDELVLDDYFMSLTPTTDASSQTQGNLGQETTSCAEPVA